MTTTTESGGRQNMFPSETRPYIDESVSYEGYPQRDYHNNLRDFLDVSSLVLSSVVSRIHTQVCILHLANTFQTHCPQINHAGDVYALVRIQV